MKILKIDKDKVQVELTKEEIGLLIGSIEVEIGEYGYTGSELLVNLQEEFKEILKKLEA